MPKPPKTIDYAATLRVIANLSDQDLRSMAGMGYVTGAQSAKESTFTVDEEQALRRAQSPAEVRRALQQAVAAIQQEAREFKREDHALLERFGVIKHVKPTKAPAHAVAELH